MGIKPTNIVLETPLAAEEGQGVVLAVAAGQEAKLLPAEVGMAGVWGG